MLATDILREEHELILSVLEVAEREAQVIAAGGPVDAERIEKIVEFIRGFADHCHHLKEEDLLFERMTAKGFPRDGGPIAVMLHEHEVGRAHVAAIADHAAAAAAGDADARQAVAGGLTSYSNLLRNHIFKENDILYPMADRAFSDDDQAALNADFERVERDEIGPGALERYRTLARELANR